METNLIENSIKITQSTKTIASQGLDTALTSQGPTRAATHAQRIHAGVAEQACSAREFFFSVTSHSGRVISSAIKHACVQDFIEQVHEPSKFIARNYSTRLHAVQAWLVEHVARPWAMLAKPMARPHAQVVVHTCNDLIKLWFQTRPNKSPGSNILSLTF